MSRPANTAANQASRNASLSLTEVLKRQRHIAFGATLTVVGLAMVSTGPTEIGGVISLAGWLGLFVAIHKYGRLGPEHSVLELGKDDL